MLKRPNILDITRQPLLIGTSSITDESGNQGFRTEYVLASAQLRIADALEKSNDILRATQVGFAAEAVEDGMNHFRLSYEKGQRVFNVQVLASSVVRAETWTEQFYGFAQDLVEAANGGRMMRLTARLPVAQAYHEAFGAALVAYNKLYEKPDPNRVFLAGFDSPKNEAIVRFADPAALFQLGICWRDAQQEGGLADA